MEAKLKPEGIDFGVLIAFVAPGFVAFKGLAAVSSMARMWLETAATREQSLGVFLFVGLASLALGLGVSGVRAVLLDGFLYWKVGALRPAVDWGKVKDQDKVVIVRDGYFRYYQFYGNMAVAVAPLLALYWASLNQWQFILGVVCVVVLSWSALDSLRGYVGGLRDLGVLRERDHEQRVRQEVDEENRGQEDEEGRKKAG